MEKSEEGISLTLKPQSVRPDTDDRRAVCPATRHSPRR
ncbi:hypothetical protein F753_24210 [Stutzerimonas chloritidismutans AW-1]|uniref:Uncharacterized protein n=1 Tax=Stutzerimonas chloritidismutans AW-1 TaxID=1263865 RepID=V4PL89_STUCH|nr:hypothetical protein F753_24210 [Stutzerimonas chloritidismutans AW-1]